VAVTVDIPDHDRLGHELPPMDGGVRIGDSELSPEVVDRQESVVEEAFGSRRKVPIIDRVGNQDGPGIGRHSQSMSQPPRSASLPSARRHCRPLAACGMGPSVLSRLQWEAPHEAGGREGPWATVALGRRSVARQLSTFAGTKLLLRGQALEIGLGHDANQRARRARSRPTTWRSLPNSTSDRAFARTVRGSRRLPFLRSRA
jgi:hypothetical protein